MNKQRSDNEIVFTCKLKDVDCNSKCCCPAACIYYVQMILKKQKDEEGSKQQYFGKFHTMGMI